MVVFMFIPSFLRSAIRAANLKHPNVSSSRSTTPPPRACTGDPQRQSTLRSQDRPSARPVITSISPNSTTSSSIRTASGLSNTSAHRTSIHRSQPARSAASMSSTKGAVLEAYPMSPSPRLPDVIGAPAEREHLLHLHGCGAPPHPRHRGLLPVRDAHGPALTHWPPAGRSMSAASETSASKSAVRWTGDR